MVFILSMIPGANVNMSSEKRILVFCYFHAAFIPLCHYSLLSLQYSGVSEFQ